MNTEDRKKHWENIYDTKQLNEVSWYQPKPKTSLELILANNSSTNISIIDIGGGDSFLVDNLLDADFTNVSVLDISANAIERAKERLDKNADKANWIVSDITEFTPSHQYNIWHDRAAFHFLTKDSDIEKYIAIAKKGIAPNGSLLIGTFSKNGPTKCSGIEIKQYSAEELEATFQGGFELLDSKVIEHSTPFDTIQEFVFCSFRRK